MASAHPSRHFVKNVHLAGECDYFMALSMEPVPRIPAMVSIPADGEGNPIWDRVAKYAVDLLGRMLLRFVADVV